MKVIAILSVDEDVLNEVKEGEETTIDKVVSEFAYIIFRFVHFYPPLSCILIIFSIFIV